MSENLPATTTERSLALKPAFSIDEARQRYGLMQRFVKEIMV